MTIETKEQARQYAIEWQSARPEKSESYLDIINDQNYLIELAEKFGLIAEFKENGII